MANYQGKGKTQQEALINLRKEAERNNYPLGLDYSGVTYLCTIQDKKKGYEGLPNSDYGIAFASALERSGIKAAKFNNPLEVIASVEYTPKEAVKTGSGQSGKDLDPSGSAPTLHGELKLTDLF